MAMNRRGVSLATALLVLACLQVQLSGARADTTGAMNRVGRAAKAPSTIVTIYKKVNYKGVAAKVSFGKKASCVAIPTKYQKKVLSVWIQWGGGASANKQCSQVTFYTAPNCGGYSLVFQRLGTAASSKTPNVPGAFALKVVSMGCK